MFKEEFTAAANGAAAKSRLLNNNLPGYFLLSMLAGMFVGFGVLLVFTLSGALAGAPITKLVMGCCFGVALSLVVMAGAELFTGNNMVMTAGLLRKTVSAAEVIKLWVICWIGNLAGSVLLAIIFNATGLYSDATLGAMTGAAAAKMSAGFIPLLARGMLCNMLVCLAVWCGFRCKTESGKLIMIFWCILAFFTTGFEHSVANMTLLSLALINNGGNEAITMGGYWYNLLTVTLGNMLGAILLVAIPYHVASRERELASGE
ncbi:MAG: formate/nitrite transporter family protein [Lachnospiraceae bacterium]|nr:formate/nitrite transporter family protein [Lachnospiraceae bacterium]